MSFRFRKSVKIAPGIRINLSKSGISTSIGKRGATVNISKRGTRVTAGIPGTGISASKLYPSKKRTQTYTPKTYSKSEWITSFVIGIIACLFFAFKTTGGAQFLSIVALIMLLIAVFATAISSKKSAPPKSSVVVPVEKSASLYIPLAATPETKAAPKKNAIPATTWQDRAAAVGALVDPKDKKSTTTGDAGCPILSGQSLMDRGLQANVNGAPTYQLADQKHNLDIMAACAEAEISNYWQQPQGERLSAAPFFFERAAILYRKNKQYEKEIEICEAWITIMNDYTTQDVERYAKVHLGPRSKAIYHRLPKARELLERSQK